MLFLKYKLNMQKNLKIPSFFNAIFPLLIKYLMFFKERIFHVLNLFKYV